MPEDPKKTSPLRQFAEITVALLLSLLIVEIGVRAFLAYHMVYDVEMSKFSMNVMQDKLYHVYKPNTSIKVMGVWMHMNAQGFRGRDYPVARTDKKRIVFLGGSYLLGWGIQEGNTFHDILERDLSKIYPTEIINTGMIDYNTEQETHLFIDKGLKYNPDKVVVFWDAMDVMATPHKSKWWFLGHSRFITLCWSFGHILAEHLDRSRNYENYYAGLYKEGLPGLMHAKQAFLLLNEICHKHNISLQVVMIPEFHNLANYPFKEEHRLMAGFLRRNGIDVFDVTPFFAGFKNPADLWVSRDDLHPNERAHQLIALRTIDFIKKDLYEKGEKS